MGTGQKLKITENIAIQGLTMCKQKKKQQNTFSSKKDLSSRSYMPHFFSSS